MLDQKKRYDFTNCPRGRSTYRGANGSKISILINNEEYMLKFPAPAKKNENMHYSNGIVCEFLGSSIFNILGIPAQQTYLGSFRYPNGKEYEVVACKDFNEMGKYTSNDFGSLKNSVITSSEGGYGTDLFSILDAIENQLYVDPGKLSQFFWEMNVVDAFIGNFDRHNGNWGFLTNNRTGEWSMAPIYDCGSSLYPQADDEIRYKIMHDKQELNTRLYQRPISQFMIEKKKIAYHDLLQSGLSPDCDKVVMKMAEVINEKFPAVLRFIREAPIKATDKDFITFVLDQRKINIIDASLGKVKRISPEERRNLFYEKYNISSAKEISNSQSAYHMSIEKEKIYKGRSL